MLDIRKKEHEKREKYQVLTELLEMIWDVKTLMILLVMAAIEAMIPKLSESRQQIS